MFYTIIPEEDLLEGMDDERQFLTITRGRLLMQVEPLLGARARLVRIISSDPQDYLDPRWQPGSTVNLVAGDFEESSDQVTQGR
jgi:hypothetical protein